MERYKIIQHSTGNTIASMLSETEMLKKLKAIGTDDYYCCKHKISYMKATSAFYSSTNICVVMLIDGFEFCTVNIRGGSDYKSESTPGLSRQWYEENNYIPATRDEFIEYAKLAINKLVETLS